MNKTPPNKHGYISKDEAIERGTCPFIFASQKVLPSTLIKFIGKNPF